LRIISGQYKGKQLNPGKNFTARPTTDFAKESLFNILNNRFDFEEIEVLDLFSGTGSISFEFASRGATKIDAVEVSPKHASFIMKTAQELKFEQLKVYRMNVYQYLKLAKHSFDIIFADPPYEMEKVEELPELILKANLLKPDGVLIFEHSKGINFADNPLFKEHRNYGNVNFSFFG
jgi:16S rRNA (guanine(966)-N(2))-methyltransferase RsmD